MSINHWWLTFMFHGKRDFIVPILHKQEGNTASTCIKNNLHLLLPLTQYSYYLLIPCHLLHTAQNSMLTNWTASPLILNRKKNYIHSVKYHVIHCTRNLQHKIDILQQIHKLQHMTQQSTSAAMTEIIFMKQWKVITTHVTQVISGVGRPHFISVFMQRSEQFLQQLVNEICHLWINTKELNKTRNSQSEQIKKSNLGILFCRIDASTKGEVNVGIEL